MTQSNEILEMNRTIAAFMGGKEYDTDRISMTINGLHNVLRPWNLKYHTSWDWLMPVVIKIKNLPTESIKRPMNGIAESVGPYINAIRPMNKGLINADINASFVGVYQFIQWYNNQTTTNDI